MRERDRARLSKSVRMRRDSRFPTFAKRGDMIQGSPCGWRPDREFLGRLASEDKDLELYWHPIRNRWSLYRLHASGAGRADDTMMKEFVFESPGGGYIQPASWLFDWLARSDKTRRGSVDPDYADRQYLKEIEREPEIEEEKEEAWRKPISEELANDFLMCINGRQSVTCDWEPSK